MSNNKEKIEKVKNKARRAALKGSGYCDYMALQNDPDFVSARQVLLNLKKVLTKEKTDIETLKKLTDEINKNKKFKKLIDKRVKQLRKEGFDDKSVVINNKNPEITETSAEQIDAFLDLVKDFDAGVTEQSVNQFKRAIVSPDFKHFTPLSVVQAIDRAGNDVSEELLIKTINYMNEGQMHFSTPITLEKILNNVGRGKPVNVAVVAGQSGVLKHFAMIFLRMTNNRRDDKYNEHTNLSVMEQKDMTRRELSYNYMKKTDDIFKRMGADRGHKNYKKRLFFGTHDKLKNDFYENEVNAVWDRFAKHHANLKEQYFEKALELAREDKFDEIPDYFNFDDVDISGLDPYAVEIVRAQYDTYKEINDLDFKYKIEGSGHPKMMQFSSPKPRIFKSELLKNFFSGSDSTIFPKNEMEALISKAINGLQPKLKDIEFGKNSIYSGKTLLDVIAEGYVLGLYNKAYGVDGIADNSLRIAYETGDLDTFVNELMAEADRGGKGSSAELKQAYESYKKRVEKSIDAKGKERYTKRMVLDENASHTMVDGKVIRIRDFIENNTEMLLKTEIERGSGRIAAGMNGITDMHKTMQEYIKMLDIENRITENKISQNDMDIYVDIIKNLELMLNGQSFYPINTGTQQFMRLMRNWQIAVSMGRLFLSQMFEFSKAISYSSFSDVFKNVPAILDYRDIFLQFREEEFASTLKNELARHVESDLHMGHLQKQVIQVLGFEPDYAAGQYIKDGTEENNPNKIMDKIVHWSMKFNNQFDTKLRMIAAMSQIRQLDRFAKSNKAGREKFKRKMYSEERLNLENFKYSDIEAIADLMNRHGIRMNGEFSGFKFQNFTDEDFRTFKKYRDYLQKMSKRIVVDKDYSNLPVIQTHPLYKTVMQFRDHGIASLTEELSYNIRSGNDAVSRQFYTYGLAMGAMIYMTQVYLSSLGREDQEEYLKKTLAFDKIMAGAFARMGFAHPPTAAIDTALSWGLGRDAIFNHRLSGHPTDFVEGTPLVGSLEAIINTVQYATGADLTQQQSQKMINFYIPNHLLIGESRRWINNNVVNPKDDDE